MLQDFITSLDSVEDKRELVKLLEKVVNIVEKSEGEYRSLVALIENIEVSPLWIIQDNGEIFAQNKASVSLNKLLEVINFSKEESELYYNNKYFLIKIKRSDSKYIITAMDITKNKQDERLVAMGKMASHLAHEIRNPIGSVSLLASTLVSIVNPEHQELVTDIQKAIWRVERIIQATLLFGKDVPNVQFDEVGIEDVQMGIQECLQYYSYEKDINLNILFPKDITLKLNLELFLIVCQNMIFNAIDAIEDSLDEVENIIEVKYSSNDLYHMFSFYDNGVDIEDKTILFQPYQSTKLRGNGLGLILAERIAKAHSGVIKLSQKRKEFLVFIKKDI